MKKILDSAIEYIDNTSRLDMAYLIVLELPTNTSAIEYAFLTNYYKNITFRGQLYESGKIKTVGAHKQNRTLTIGSLYFSITGTDSQEVIKVTKEGVSFLDKSVTIYQAIIQSDGEILPFMDDGSNDPFLYFKGKVTSASIKDDTVTSGAGSTVITWYCSNQFYDFDRVNGRYTDDASHRALEVVNGELVPSASVKRLEYKDDLGFFHSNKSVSILAKYQVQELRYRLQSKKKFGGLSKSYSLQEYYETVTKEVDLDFNLAGKFIPVVYGTQNVPGLPVFVDTELHNPNIVYVVYVFSEGEIEGFLDFYVGDAPMICHEDTDATDRICIGRKKIQGDTMQRIASGAPTSSPSIHGQEYIYNDGNGDIRIWTYHGKSDQEAPQVLVDIAAANGFFLQNENGIGPEYLDNRFRLLDTAYAVVRFTITEDRTDIPEITAELQGKKIRVFDSSGSVTSDFTSLNGVWQTLDYLTSDRYGAGISIDQIPITNMIAQAALLDIQDESYEASWNTYWRYTGWNNTSNNNRQVVQLNTILDTSASVFKNTQELLDSYKGSLNSLCGEYRVTIEKFDNNPRKISFKDTYGDIELSDSTGRDKFNSVQASIIDPAMGWKANSVTFFNSEFKAIDKGVDKKLQLSFSAITNYYTARSFAARELKKSRYSRSLTFSLPYKFIGIEPNDAIAFTYDRYDWKDKYFLVEEVENTASGKINITVQEYEEDVFINSAQVNVDTPPPVVSSIVLPPRDVVYSPASIGNAGPGVNGSLSWLPSLTNNVTYYTIRTSYAIDPFVVEAIGSNPNVRMTFNIDNQPDGLVIFEIRAVDINGKRSSPVTLAIEINAALNLSPVANFVATNMVAGTREFFGADVLLTWDAIPEASLIAGINYRLQIMDSTGVVMQELLLNSLAYTYLLVTNKQDYALLHNGDLGINRVLSFRIRAEGPSGERSISWTNL